MKLSKRSARNNITVAMTDEEVRVLDERANASGMSRASWIRFTALRFKLNVPDEISVPCTVDIEG